ncbi:hypothetical protein HYH02_014289 [Chlamydomonas schloesseri]|uniref:STI1 domain-containing protein n=1 Tax=Chlamydomonas schloesseri TaxID=2026947 RepID=A0A835SK03_9CHLO|nr:hypothetical protein HYH02_014289 [Chlamydomonas schloesseri]|eukprot:KAG2428587.1 hypothetical protein HYH02_014289 [Chlamydomonas schloesseri]
MDANTMQFAMEQMRKMSPEQLQQMQGMMKNMPPDMMQQAMAQMKDMKPEDWERAKQQMSGMDGDTMARQAAQAQAQMAGRTQYVLNASNQLKAEGNQLHGRGAFSEAAEKYERAKTNVVGMAGKEAADLARACTLNLSSCYLNLKQFSKCLEQCNSVLASEPANLKALYRRGQAYMGTGSWLDACADLEKALKLAKETDPSQAGPIRDKLQETKDQVSVLRASGKLPAASASGSGSAAAMTAATSTSNDDGDGVVEEVKEAPAPPATSTAARAAASTGASTSSSSVGAGPLAGMDMDKMQEMVAKNPEMLKQAQEMMKGMSDEQLRAMAKQMGVPDASIDALRGGLDPDLMAKVAKVQSELPPELLRPDAARDPESMKKVAEMMAKNPEMAKTMGEVLSSIDPSKLQEMAKQAGMPAGVTITPEMAKMAAESFKNMSPEELQAAMATASKMGPPPASLSASSADASSSTRAASAAGASTSGRSSATPASSSSSLAAAGLPPMPPGGLDPRAAAEMMAAMPPEQLAEMAKMMPGGAGMAMTPEAIKMAAEMMKNMSPEEMARMTEMAASLQATAGAGSSAAGNSSGRSAVAAAAAGAGPSPAPGPGGMPQMTPEMAKMAADMMKNMSPDDLAKMTEMASKMGMGPGGAAGMPAGGMAGMADMMKNMKPEDIARMTEMASKMGMGPGAAGLGAGGKMPDMGSMGAMMQDPKMMESMVKMMKSMDPDALAGMLMSSGMVKDRAQADAMAQQLGSLSDAQLNMMIKATAAVQGVRDWARKNILLIAALVVLLLALLMRWLGYM